jgi:hypothetical protein
MPKFMSKRKRAKLMKNSMQVTKEINTSQETDGPERKLSTENFLIKNIPLQLPKTCV